jgi:hypothetical protein
MSSPALAPYHVGQQRADVLLGPIEAELGVLTARVAHYGARLRMEDADRAALAQAHSALAAARDAIAALRAKGA